MRRRQPNPESLLERITIQEMCQSDVLRDKPGRMNEYALIVALASLLLTGRQLMDFCVELLAREQAGFDRAPELALQHVEIPAVDDDLVELRPAGRIELAASERDESAARLQPGLAADDIPGRGTADDDFGATHHLLDRILGHDRNSECLRPFFRE